MDEKLVYSLEETARLLGISASLAYTMAKENKLPVIRFGKRILIPKKALTELLEKVQCS